ncbi:unnamed protein product [Linum tenue]|uniref:Uncharacterized protein n=1 Tax=Linum tenue TaxID=586396 RepID=A0AAV0QTZ9_9ROSI|nr:unnamed protein product [Linum tenue]
MASISGALQHQNPTFQSTAVFNILDPISLILSQNSCEPISLKLTAETYAMERGPRYTAYAQLRESKLRTKTTTAAMGTAFSRLPESETESWRQQTSPPLKKQVKFKHQLHPFPSPVSRRASGYGASMVAQSVPDFSAALRKENRKPPPSPAMAGNLTPSPCKSGSKVQGVLSSRGSKSVGSGEKRRGVGNGGGSGLMARKSYASVEELKGLSAAASNSIMNGENRVGGLTSSSRGNGGRGNGNTVLGYRHHY